MRAFLTGATGFVGRALVRELARQGIDITGYCRDPARTAPLDGLGVRWVRGNLLDEESLTRAMAGCDVVFHVAALLGYDPREDRELRQVNVLGARAVARACLAARAPRLVHTSSIAACAHTLDGRVLDETAPWNSGSLRIGYFTTKHGAELEVRDAVERGLDAVIVNPGAIFGAGSDGNTATTLQDLSRGKIPVAPSGGSACVGVDDVVAGHLAAWKAGRRGERYVLTSENLSWRDLLAQAASALGVKGPFATAPRTLTDTAAMLLDLASRAGVRQPNVSGPALRALGVFLYFDGKKSREELGLRPAPMRQVLAQTVADLRARGRVR